MPPRIYLTVAEAVELHRLLIEEFGGLHGTRDQGLLEFAVFRPQNGYYNSVFEEAAALMESLGNNHAFLDGNKRISFAATDTMLRSNGHFLDVDSHEAHKFIEGSIQNKEFRFPVIHDWLVAISKPLID
jgi:death on curing protein